MFVNITSSAQVVEPNSARTAKTSEQPQKNPRASEVVVRGQVFIVTKGRENIKLGLVTVSAFSRSDFERQVADIAKQDRERLVASRSRAVEREERVAARAAAIERAKLEEVPAREAFAAAKAKAGLARALDSASIAQLSVPKAGDGAELLRLKSDLKTLAAYRVANPNSDYVEYQRRQSELEIALRREIFKQAGIEPTEVLTDQVEAAEHRFMEAAAALARAEAIQVPPQVSTKPLDIDGYIALLRSPLTSTKTDADGNFELRLPQGAFVFAASTSRAVPRASELEEMLLGRTEYYSWLINVHARQSGDRVFLSNDNMSGNSCAECVILNISR